ncbi:DUF1194 domain-containing protein [Pseudooceanicola sp.]|uniref:DUF1194 domain-containing protein n=1 Tax=Pseudooceanicola sp. TaxID=1914328 RepID=UPI0026277018|nr:DUF1194 domain-containing protein [Pseudooceanicola sp.]MDF1855596.1 DUF1194 domain-containing protein [Pseudooceanicola sp.]
MRRVFALVIALISAPPVAAQVEPYDPSAIEVDVELLLLVDVSRSMTPSELEIQRRGYAEALTSDSVLNVIGDGFLGHIAVAYVEWAGAGSQRVVVDWRLIRSRDDAQGFAEALTLHFTQAMRRTSISGALAMGPGYFRGNRFAGLRRVIDISGDGPNNDGAPVLPIRDQVLAEGITINGLPLMTRDGIAAWNLDDLDIYYQTCVTGGAGSFVIPVYDWAEFAAAVRKKLVLEIAGKTPAPPRPEARVIPTQASPGRDCLIGEKMWQRSRDLWEPL